jgi:dihydrofolate reductase
MNYELIVAMSKNGVIGNNNKLPWYIPEDLVNFSELTKGHIIIMGRKTFESLPNGPLKNRLNVVLSRTIYNNNNNFDENVLFTTMDYLNTILKLHQKHNQKIFIIGGSEIYNIFIEQCNKLHITMVDEIIDGDSYFPFDKNFLTTYYKVVNKSEILYSKNKNIPYQYMTYDRK